MVGLVVFLPEGLQKLLFPALLGAGRFATIGIPWPEGADLCMLLGSLYLLIVGGGAWSVDALLKRRIAGEPAAARAP